MKINQVRQFLRSNISRFEPNRKNTQAHRIFNIYDKNNSYRGEYQFKTISGSDSLGIQSSLSTVRIMTDDPKQLLQECVYMHKNYVTFKDKNSDTLTKALPSEITTTTTILDFVNDRFKTIKSVSKLKNKLQKIEKNNPNLVHSDDFIIYKPLEEKPKYEKSVEYVREGTITEATRENTVVNRTNDSSGNPGQFPYMFW